jgi:hypothetical protein
MKGREDMVVAIVMALVLVGVIVLTFAWLSGWNVWGVLAT